jgi:hypothetical protein
MHGAYCKRLCSDIRDEDLEPHLSLFLDNPTFDSLDEVAKLAVVGRYGMDLPLTMRFMPRSDSNMLVRSPQASPSHISTTPT